MVTKHIKNISEWRKCKHQMPQLHFYNLPLQAIEFDVVFRPYRAVGLNYYQPGGLPLAIELCTFGAQEKEQP